MPDNRQGPPDRKLALIAPLAIVAVAAVAVVSMLIVRAVRHPTERPAAIAVTPAPLDLAAPLPAPPLSRTDIIQEANAVAASFAAGTAPSGAVSDPMVGRRFVVRIPFGCEGSPTSATAQATVDYDASKRTVRLSARPGIWTSLPLVQGLPGAGKIESVEGFWIPRPWTYSNGCPPPHDVPVPTTPTPAAPPTLGLARVFETDGSRVLQRGTRPYEFVRRLPEDDASILSHTYRLVLEGRIVGYARGRAARCWSESPDHRPLCLYAVDFDRVAFEDAADGAIMAEWRE